MNCRWLGIAISIVVFAGCSATPSGTVKIVEVQTDSSMGQTTRAILDLTGPITNGVVRCEFSGPEGSSLGWTIYVQVPDMPAGATTRSSCEAFNFGYDAPSSPLVQLVSRSSLPPPRANSKVEYYPPTPWP